MRYTEAVWTTFITVLQTQSYSKIKCLPLCLSNLSTYLPICDAALVSFHRGGPPPLHSFFTGLSLFSHVLQRMWWPPLPQTKKILKVVVIQRVWAMALGRNNWKHQPGDSLPGDPILSDPLGNKMQDLPFPTRNIWIFSFALILLSRIGANS